MTVEYSEDELKARFRLFMKAGKRSLSLWDVEVADVRDLKFKTINAIKDILSDAPENMDFQILSVVFANFDKEFSYEKDGEQVDVKVMLEFLYHIIDGITAIANMELESFESEASDVDTSGLDKFKETNIIDTLAGGNILEWERVSNLPYFDIFIKMLMIQENNKIEKARARLNK